MTGSVEAGAAAFKDISNFATQTQFGVEELTQTYIKLKTAGIEPTKELLTTFTDVAAVTTDQLGSLEAITDLFSRTISGGLGLEELNRLADRGVPVFKILEEQLGLTRLEVAEFGKTAEGAAKIRDALVKGFNQDFGGATQDRLQNLSTSMSNFGIAATNAADTFGQGFAPALGEVTGILTDFVTQNEEAVVAMGKLVGDGLQFVVDNIKPLAIGLGTLTAAWAAYKVAVVAATIASNFNPIIAAITALAAGVALIVMHWDDVKYAGQEAARLVQLGIVKLAKAILDTLGAAIQSIIDLFSDLKAVGVAVGAGIAAAFKNPLNATEAFKEAFADTMQEMQDGQNKAVKPFQAEVDKLAAKEAELQVATERVSTEIKELADVTQDVAKETAQATENVEEHVEASDDLNSAVEDYIKNLEKTGIETKKTTRERELEKKIIEEQEAAAKAAGVTLAKLSEEQLEAIREIVTAKYEEAEAQEAAEKAAVKAAEAAIKAEQDKQEEIKRTLELTDEYYIEAVAGAKNYREQLEREGKQVRELTGLYGTERDVAEELYEFRSQAAEDIARLEAAEQDLREKGATEEADQVKQKIANLKVALKEEEAAIEAAARANSEYQRSFVYGWREAYARFSDDATNNAKIAGEVFDTFATGMSDALYNFAMTGKLSFKDLVDSMKSTIARFLADRITQKFLQFIDEAVFGNKSMGTAASSASKTSTGGSSGGGKSGGGIIDSAIDFVKGLFGFADGGYIPGNKMAIVGERGPELFMPSGSGTIIPNFANGGAGAGVTNVTYNINAVDARSFKQLVAQDPEFIYNVTLAGSRRVPQ